ncbi:MAG TPA: hypothetical protein VJ957_10745, partial [Longimicrobiales bacterium]|nr:hypothetical protein [Longimicrobiales bacterium]
GVLRGVVMGADGPVANLPVALHRVMPDGSGTMLDQTQTDTAGQFTFDVALTADSAVYFAATRIGDNLYVGPAIKDFLPTGPYVIDVGPDAQAIPMGGGGPPGTSGLASGPEVGTGGAYGHGWMGLLAIVVAGVVIALLTWSRRPRMSAEERKRSRLLRLAALEEEHAGRVGTLDPAEQAQYEAQRDQLRDELLGR